MPAWGHGLGLGFGLGLSLGLGLCSGLGLGLRVGLGLELGIGGCGRGCGYGRAVEPPRERLGRPELEVGRGQQHVAW